MRLRRSVSALVLVAAALAAAACGGGGKNAAGGSGGCTDVSAPKPKSESGLQAPTTSLDSAKTYKVKVETNCGDFTITLDVKESPKTTASFVYLADKGYFDDTIFHRIAPGFVIQGGDPTQQGSGGPGYTTVEAPPAGVSYVRYTVAMAKTGSQPAGAAGSQFFVVTAPDAGLPPDYALLGKVTEGQAVVDRIGKLGNTSEQPTRTVEIEHMSVES